VRVEFHEELLLDPSQLASALRHLGGDPGFPTGSSGSIGLQADRFNVDGQPSANSSSSTTCS